MTNMAVIGLDLGGTKLASGVFTPTGKILRKRTVPLAGCQGRTVGDLIARELNSLLTAARARRVQVRAVGISVPGISHSDTGKVWAPNIPGWEDYPLRREILAVARDKSLVVAMDSDRACYILGEAWRGAARGCRNAIFLAVGTGIGAGILIDGQVLRGTHDIAGAIGWLALERPFRPHYAGCGCFEYHASGAGLAKVANEILAQHPAPAPAPSPRAFTPLIQHPFVSAEDVFAAYDRGDAVAKKVIGQAVEFWGMAVANLVSLLNPEKIIFGGGVFGPGAKLLDDVYAEAKRWAQPISIQQVKLQASRLGGDAGLYGAGWLALQAAKARA